MELTIQLRMVLLIAREVHRGRDDLPADAAALGDGAREVSPRHT
jgi:hypothetical protein